MTYVIDNWSGQKMTQAQMDGWMEILPHLRRGELKPTLRGFPGTWRPDAPAVLEAAQLARRRIPFTKEAEEYARNDSDAQAAERVFSQYAHLMPSRRNRAALSPQEGGA